jgi:hypothetical protein
MKLLLTTLLTLFLLPLMVFAQDSTRVSRKVPPPPPPPPSPYLSNPYLIQPANISYEEFEDFVKEVRHYRSERRVRLDTFLLMAKDPNTILLDTRSSKAFHNMHLKGAVHLNFSDFTDEKLAKVIPDTTTRILIYCNNNFVDEEKGFPGKRRPLALNIPTFINLYGYGYKNVYEMGGLHSVYHPKLEFEGLDVQRIEAVKARFFSGKD